MVHGRDGRVLGAAQGRHGAAGAKGTRLNAMMRHARLVKAVR